MKIIYNKFKKYVIMTTTVEFKTDMFRRILYDNGTIEWQPIGYDGECDDLSLEIDYQKALKR